MPLRILLIDPQGSALDWAMRCQAAGHDVKWYIRPRKDGTPSQVGDGIIEKVKDYQEWRKWPDLVFLPDNTLYLKDMDAWRRDGITVVGATEASAQLELDRQAGQDVFTKHGIKVLEGEEFSDYDSALTYVAKTDDRLVSKPCGNVEDKGLSYVSHGPEDMTFMLERWKKQDKLKTNFILQKFVPGIEMAVGGWIGPHGFLPVWCENFEFKKLMNDDKGVATGEQGTVLRYVTKSKLAEKVLAPCEDTLLELGHTGYVDVNCIIDDEGNPWPLEWTMRPGWPTFNIQQPLCFGDPAEWLLNLARATSMDSPFRTNPIAVGVVMSIPDYPFSHATKKEVTGVPVYGVKDKNAANIHPCEMMLGAAPLKANGKMLEAPMLVTAGDYILVTTGTGGSVRAAKARAYSVMESLTVPNSPQYRTDIGNRLSKELRKLQSHGYALGMSW